MNDICFRRMTKDDLADADELRRIVGWNQTPSDWLRFLELSPKGCFVATKNGLLLGTVTSLTYEQTLSWVGMMLVHPDYRRQGIATHLLSRLLDYLHDRRVKCIKLDATPAGFGVYKKLGFVPEWTMTRRQGPGKGDASSLNGMFLPVRNLRDADWEAVEAIDKTVLGVSRGTLLRGLAQHSLRSLVWPSKGRVVGWGLLRVGSTLDHLGPVVCPDNEGALSLVHELLAGAKNPSVFWDVPDGNPAAVSAAEGLGFAPLRTLTRMRLGPPLGKSDPLNQFAIADPSAG